MTRDEYDLNFILRFQRDVQWILDFQLHKQLIVRDVQNLIAYDAWNLRFI